MSDECPSRFVAVSPVCLGRRLDQRAQATTTSCDAGSITISRCQRDPLAGRGAGMKRKQLRRFERAIQ